MLCGYRAHIQMIWIREDRKRVLMHCNHRVPCSRSAVEERPLTKCRRLPQPTPSMTMTRGFTLALVAGLGLGQAHAAAEASIGNSQVLDAIYAR